MEQKRSRMKGSKGDDQLKRYGKILILPLLVIILIIIIISMDKSPEREPVEVPSETVATGTNAVDEAVSEYPEYELTEEEVPEIHALMESYFQAKLDCDPAALEKVFGNANTGDTTDLQEKMQMETEYIEDYRDIICYTKPGLDENSYMVYVRFNVKFRLTDTLAPGLLWCYVSKDAEGNFYIQEEPDDKVNGYIAFVDQSEDVRELAAQVNTDLETALASDSKLASIYQILREGADPAAEATDSEAQAKESEESQEESTEPAQTETAETESASE